MSVGKKELRKTTISAIHLGDPDTLTERKIRRDAEKRLKLPEKTLDQPEYKALIKELVNSYLENPAAFDNDNNAQCDVDEEDDESAKVKSRVNESEDEKVAKTQKEGDEQKELDGDDEDLGIISKPGRTRKRPQILDDEDVDSDEDNSRGTSVEPASDQRKSGDRAKAPAKKKRKSSTGKTGGAVQISEKHQKTIDSLKKYINLCGVKKRWTTEFEGLDGNGRIRKLKKILAELGISDRPTVEKCKKIKAKREFEAEVGDLDLSNIVGDSGRRTRRGHTSGNTSSIDLRRIGSPETDSD